MDSRNPNPNNPPPSMRVLTRPPASPTPPPASPSDPRQPDGVVVVGFVSRSPEASSQLINRVLDSNAFGSGRLDKPISPDDKAEEELRDWFRHRRISYYHEEDKGMVFLLLSATRCPVLGGLTGQSSGLYPFSDNWEFEELQGMIFMFSVCHVILYIQEGSNFDTQALKKLRVLQAAKNSLAPYVRSRAAPPFLSRPNSLSNSGKRTTLAGSSPGRGGGIVCRNASAVSLMSGLGSSTSLFPGQCTPVLLFVFVDEFPDVSDPGSSLEESTDNSSLNPSSNLSSIARTNLPAKGSGPVVMLARPGNKSEGGFRKKLQSSLEAQIRFLIKKCRILTGSESGHTGSRSGAVSSSTPLFSLDTSRAVALLDRCSVQRTESLEFAIDLVEDVLNGKATSEIFLLESHAQSSNKEDILMIKDFIYRQCDMVRGRGGLVTGTNCGPSGVGMVAVAAAAAAASAASGKAFATPELPTLETWLSSSKAILNGVLSAKGGCIDDPELVKRKPNQRNSSPVKAEGVGLKGTDPIDVAVSQLESGRGLITKFSTSWCEKVLPTAMDVYLKDLPACYPTSQHEARLEKAVRSFHSMVRGPVVKLFAKKLEDDCMSIWKSGRQQCDAVSLTGKPCIYQRHEVTNGETTCSPLNSHSSGYFFLHACACGRSRRLRPDPFDMESANVSFNCFPDCEKLLPAVQLPEDRNAEPVQSSSWKLVRIGGATYYEPSKGLLQSGFSAKQRYLLNWTISPDRSRSLNTSPAINLQQGSLNMSGVDPDIVSTEIDVKRSGIMRLQWGNIQNVLENQREMTEKSQIDDKKISFGAGVPNFTMRKPFAEVVAGSSASDSFPPLKQRKHASSSSEKSIKQNKAKNYREQRYMAADQTSQKPEDNPSGRDISGETSNGVLANDPLLHIGSNVVPVSVISGETEKMSSLSEPAFVYVGFEHECPRGHRFLLNPDQLDELETSYPLTESITSSFETFDPSSADPSNGKNNSNDKVDRSTRSMVVNSSSKLKGADRSKCVLANGDVGINGMVKFQGLRKEPDQVSTLTRADSHSLKNVHVELHRLRLDDGGSVFNMLNRDLPIYMNCPYCKKSKDKKDETKIKFAGAVSQLQRIFLVTPPLRVVLATCPVVQFEVSCLPETILEKGKRLQFSFGCPVILPPESFLTLRLPFVYGTKLEDGSLHPLKALDTHPERTAWIEKGTAIQVLSKKSSASERPQT